MATWGVTASCALLALGVLSCAGDDAGSATTTTVHEATTTTASSTTTTAPERPSSTTTTAYDPSAVEGQVEAAYLRSWDVYADAVYNLNLDESALAAVFADEHLETKRNEIQGRIDEGRASWVRLDHDYSIQLTDPATAIVIDRYQNHQVLIDPATKEPVEADPNVEVIDVTTLKLLDGVWKVTRVEGVQ